MSGMITLFAACYGLAWLLEISRLFFRSGVRTAVMLGCGAAGLVAHTMLLVYRAWQMPGSPLSSSFDWYLVAAWLLAGAYLYLTYHYPHALVGVFILPLVLALVAAAALVADRQPFAPEPAWRVWGAIHGGFLVLGTVTVMVGFVAGIMYLIQSIRLKRRLPPTLGFRFPSLERLEKVNSRVIVLSALLIGVGFIAGIILRVVAEPRALRLPWTDPVVWSSGMMLAWLLVAAVFNQVYRPARQGRKVAYLTVVSFVFLAFALGVFLFVDTEHAPSRVHRRESPSQSGRLEPGSVRLANREPALVALAGGQ